MTNRTGFRWSTALLLCVACMAPASALAQAPDAFRFQQGDGLRILVWENPALSGDFAMLPSGRLEHPLLQDIQVVGRSFAEVERDVLDYLAQFQRAPRAIISPLYRIFVGGEVRAPQVVSVDPRAHVFDLIAQAGGPSTTRPLNRVEISSPQGTTKLDLDDAAARRELQSLGVQSGNQVMFFAPRSAWRHVMPVVTFLGSTLGIAHFIWNVTR